MACGLAAGAAGCKLVPCRTVGCNCGCIIDIPWTIGIPWSIGIPWTISIPWTIGSLWTICRPWNTGTPWSIGTPWKPGAAGISMLGTICTDAPGADGVTNIGLCAGALGLRGGRPVEVCLCFAWPAVLSGSLYWCCSAGCSGSVLGRLAAWRGSWASGRGWGNWMPWSSTDSSCFFCLLLYHWIRVFWLTSTSCIEVPPITKLLPSTSCLILL